MNKNKKVFIIAIIAIVIVLLIGVAYAFLATDMFKSNKDLFLEYAAKMFDDDGFIDSSVKQYYEKKGNSSYENEGKVNINVDSETLDNDKMKNITNLSIDFAGNADITNKKTETLVKIKYNDDVNFPIYYKKVDDICGIKLSEIAKGYFAWKENEFGEVITKMSKIDKMEGLKDIPLINSESVMPDLSNVRLNQSENDKIKTTYFDLIKNNIDKANFTKIQGMETDGYSLELDNKDLKELLVKLLEKLKDDEVMIDKVSKITGNGMRSSDIEAKIDDLNENGLADGKTIITIFGKDKKANKIEIQFNDELKITISKESSDDEKVYNIEVETIEYLFSIKLSYIGLENLEKVTEKYEISYSDNTNGDSYYYNIQNDVRFTNDIDIKDFKEKEYVDFNKLSDEKLKEIVNIIQTKVRQVSDRQMGEAGIIGENPVINFIPGLTSWMKKFDIYQNEEGMQTQEQPESTQETPETPTVPESSTMPETPATTPETPITDSSSNNLVTNMEELEKQTFNDRIKQYEGNTVSAPALKSLMMQVIASNMAYEDKKITVTGDVVLTGDEVPDTIDSTKTYTVKCSTGTDGFINKVEVKIKK